MLKKIIYILIYNIFKRDIHKRSKKGSLLSIVKKISVNSKKRHTIHKIKINGNIVEYTDNESFIAMYKEIFEHEIYNFNCKTDVPKIIDCGANIGLSIMYFKKKFPNAKITAFEADPLIFNVLKNNISNANLTNISIIQKALWNEETTILFNSDNSDGGHISNNSKEGIKVETIRLSKYINEKIDFLKIDIEGAELEVLQECKDKLHFVDKVFVEYHSFKNRKQDLNEILNILSANDFRYFIDNLWNIESPFVEKLSDTIHNNLLNIFAWK
ncbi:MAG: hypothetical protein B6I20_13885 [Bacteroidetes bacterium 4572_117]|nr:MAG: hypothetical protein B6I20_13885 [Bacteroidetes bacterium 4572_117]